MSCAEIQEKLSAYIEGIISSEEKSVIDEHLKSCEKCSESLADLRKTLEHMKNLEDVEPPQWLTQKIMTKVKAEEKSRKGIWGRLFYPLHVKLPIEAAATLLIAVTAFYIFKSMQPGINLETYRFAKEASESAEPRSSIQKKDRSQIGLKEKESVVARDEIVSPRVRDDRKSWTSDNPPVMESKPVLKEEERPSREAAQEVNKFAEAPKSPEPAEKRAMMKASGAIPEGKAETKILSDGGAAGGGIDKEKIRSFTLKMLAKDFEITEKNISNDIIQLGGKIIKVETSDGDRILFAQLSQKKLGDLIERLGSIGEVKERNFALEVLEGNVVIRIKIIGGARNN